MTVAGILKRYPSMTTTLVVTVMETNRPGLVEALSKALAAHHEPKASCLIGSSLDSISSVASSLMIPHPESLTVALTYMHKLSRLLSDPKFSLCGGQIL